MLELAGKLVFVHFCVDLVDLIQSMAIGGESKALVGFHQLSINAFPSLWEALCKELAGLPESNVNRQLLIIDGYTVISKPHAATGSL